MLRAISMNYNKDDERCPDFYVHFTIKYLYDILKRITLDINVRKQLKKLI